MKRLTTKLFVALLILIGMIPTTTEAQKETLILVQTTMGNLKIKLYDETPMHKENFIKLVNQKYYDGLLFHRVIKNFMIQGGDPNSKNAAKGASLGNGGPNYTIPAELNKKLFHKKGALAAARMGDNVNPRKESSGSQFYIVQGNVVPAAKLTQFEMQTGLKFSDEQRTAYSTVGGTPHLDMSYTVFGEVVEGLELIDKLGAVPCDQRDRPVEDVKIITMTIVK